MPQTIARIYASQEAANAALNDLRGRGFTAHIIQAGGESGIDAITRAGIDRAHAEIYSDHIQRGETLVVVEPPPFGQAGSATSILESHNPLKIDLPAVEATQQGGTWDWYSPTPLSSWLGWQVLLDDPTPLSTSLNQPVLKAEPTSSKTLDGIRELSAEAAPLSSKLGIPLLFENPAPLSARFGWRLLLDKAALLSERFGWPVLLDGPTLLSSKLGWRVLLDNPAPLSSALGLKVLTRD